MVMEIIPEEYRLEFERELNDTGFTKQPAWADLNEEQQKVLFVYCYFRAELVKINYSYRYKEFTDERALAMSHRTVQVEIALINAVRLIPNFDYPTLTAVAIKLGFQRYGQRSVQNK